MKTLRELEQELKKLQQELYNLVYSDTIDHIEMMREEIRIGYEIDLIELELLDKRK